MIRKSAIVLLTLFAGGSYVLSFVDDEVKWLQSDHTGRVIGDTSLKLQGGALLFIQRQTFDQTTPPWPKQISLMPLFRIGSHQDLMRQRRHMRGDPSFLMQTVTEVNLGCLCILFAAYPTFAFIRGPMRRWRRRKRGLCVECGYNLKGNVSGVCSECGAEM